MSYPHISTPRKILFVATKSPWPTIDGGRLLMAGTLRELTSRGHRVTLVAPSSAGPAAINRAANEAPDGCVPHLVPSRPRPLWLSFLLSQFQGRALSTVRHSLDPVRLEVERLLDTGSHDLIHVEQLQALAQAEPALRRGLPVVLRTQNVESDLWAGIAAARPFFGLISAREARRLARDEGRAVARVPATVALTAEDAIRLGELAGGQGRIHVVRVPFAATLPAAEKPLDGNPAVVLLGSAGWLPNRDAALWFIRLIWPAIHTALPAARLHVFGHLVETQKEAAPGISSHGPPENSRDVFAPGSVMVVPLRIGSGVRMKILEAWARGVPVVGTPQAVRGLDANHGDDLLVAADQEGFVNAFKRLAAEPELAERLVRGGRTSLAQRHDSERVTNDLLKVYEQLIPSH